MWEDSVLEQNIGSKFILLTILEECQNMQYFKLLLCRYEKQFIWSIWNLDCFAKLSKERGWTKKQNWETQYDLPQETTSRKKLHWQQQQPQPPPVRKEATVFCPSFTSEWCIKKLEPLPWLGVEQKLFIRQSSMMRLHYKFLDRSGDHQAGGELVKSSNILHHPSCGLVPVFCRARIWDKVLANIGWNLTCKASFLHLLWHYTTYS